MSTFFTSYETVKYVAIQDIRLGMLRTILLLSILGYVIIIELIYNNGYLQSFPVNGVVRFSLQQPTENNCNPSLSDCSNNFAPLSTLPYCQQHNKKIQEFRPSPHQQHQQQPQGEEKRYDNPQRVLHQQQSYIKKLNNIVDDNNNNKNKNKIINSSIRVDGKKRNTNFHNDSDETAHNFFDDDYSGPVYPCQIYEAVNAQVVRETSIVIWTRATSINQTLICNENADTCPRTYENNYLPLSYDKAYNNNNNHHNHNFLIQRKEEKSINHDDITRPIDNANVDVDADEATDNADTPFYIAQAEAFTILLEHAVTASSICRRDYYSKSQKQSKSTSPTSSISSTTLPPYACSSQARQYSGRLRSDNPMLCQLEYAKNNSYTSPRENAKLSSDIPCYIGANKTKNDDPTSSTTTTTGGRDFFSLDVLLQAAGVSLDDCIHYAEEDDDGQENCADRRNDFVQGTKEHKEKKRKCLSTIRSSGATLLLEIVWNDAISWRGKVRPHYTYIPQLIGDYSYKESLAFYYQPYRQSRILFQAHGIKVAVMVSGTFHEFQMIQFLVTLTTALGLLAVARVVVDNLMLYVLPNKERYQQAKYETVNPTDGDAILPVNNNNAPDHENANGTNQGTAYHDCPVTTQQDHVLIESTNGTASNDTSNNNNNDPTEPLLPEADASTMTNI